MTKPELYRKENLSNVRNRNTSNVSIEENDRINLVVSKFFELFKFKHLG